jgi:F-type H+-transporting ATPase subunit a
MLLAALEFPTIDEIVRFRPVIGNDGDLFALNKVGIICILSMVCTLALFLIGGRGNRLVPAPKGAQALAEMGVDFVRDGIVKETMGHDGLGWMPYLTTLFFFIFFCNLTEIIPGFQMPATARMGIPLFLSLLTWLLFIITGVVKQGPRYFKEALFPPGVPTALYVLVVPIEFLSTFLVRPFSLAVRLFANTLAGHILLVTFAVLTSTLISAESFALKPVAIFPFVMLVLMTGFELMVAFLQAYIFVILTAVYIGGAMHPEH